MSNQSRYDLDISGWTRRRLLGTGLSLTALGSAITKASAADVGEANESDFGAPFTSMRDYVNALAAAGLVVRVPEVNQDEYEATALMYRMRDQFGMNGAPTVIFEKIRIDGQWVEGPLVINESGHPWAECIAFGIEPEPEEFFVREPFASYRKARAYHEATVAKNDGQFPLVDTRVISQEQAPCRQVVLKGNDVDLTRFQFIQGNPTDAGRYINTGVVFTDDQGGNRNIGTYRCHLRGPRELGLNSEPGQAGYGHLMAARERGEKTAHISIALGVDPYIWAISGSKLSPFGTYVDELAMAGGLAGRPVELVRCETNHFMVPAHSEMIIEGEVPLDDMRPEGPYGEMYGYQGRMKTEQFWIRVTAVTHRVKPWIFNNFTGVQRGTLMAPAHGHSLHRMKQYVPELTDYWRDNRAVGVGFASIRKTRAGQGLDVAEKVARYSFGGKLIVVVDDDLDVMNQEQMLAALGARWQPKDSFTVLNDLPGIPMDPSSTVWGRTGKMAIDATRQWPEEGGPETYVKLNRILFEQNAPEAFSRVDQKWSEFLQTWRPA